jgi:hypothetical protein
MKEKSEESTPEESSIRTLPRLQKKDFPFSSKRGFWLARLLKGGEGGSLGVLKWKEKIISYREVTHRYLHSLLS